MAKCLKSISGIRDKMTSRGFLMSALSTSTLSSLPVTIMPLVGGAVADPVFFGSIASGIVIVITAIGSIIVYVKSRKNSRRAIEKSAFGRILTDKERKEYKTEFKNAKLKAKLDKKAEQALLKAEENLVKQEQSRLEAEAKLLKKQVKKVNKVPFRRKIKGLPLRVVLAGVKFLNMLAVEIPKTSVPDVADIATDTVPDVVQGKILPSTGNPTDTISSIGGLPELGVANGKLPTVGPETSLTPLKNPITPVTNAPGSTPMAVTSI